MVVRIVLRMMDAMVIVSLMLVISMVGIVIRRASIEDDDRNASCDSQ
jgi:hypothetical protein